MVKRLSGAVCLGLLTTGVLADGPATLPAADASLTSATEPTPLTADTMPATTATPPPQGYVGSVRPDTLQGGNDFLPLSDRWRIGLPGNYLEDRRDSRGLLTNPYNQNILKGDYPAIDDDKFFALTVTSDTLFEARKLPVPSGVSSASGSRFDFFGQGDQQLIVQNTLVSAELFKGDAGFKPKDWSLRATVAYSVNYVHTSETGLVDVNVGQGRDRDDEHFGVQELFAEYRLADISPNFDFLSVRAGVQPFNADFRGFLFADNQPGIRFFGNADNNRVQYNAAAFATLEKDTNSGLNDFDLRDQFVFVANVYRQDFIFEGYTAQLSIAANIDNGDQQFDENGFLARPSPLGTIDTKHVRAYYLGWAGDGKIGRFNVTHQFYQVLGTEDNNPIAGRDTTINAQFFAIELSYDMDWQRYRAGFLYASGDSNPTDGQARGFDSIFDDPNFAGGGTSYFTRQAIKLTGSGVNLTNRNSMVPDLRTSKEQGQANFVNPGLLLYTVGADFDVTPKLTVSTNVNYMQFDTPETLRLILNDNGISSDIGLDVSVGLRYRPLHNNNMIINAGAAALIPADGFKELYSSETLYSTFMSLTLTF